MLYKTLPWFLLVQLATTFVVNYTDKGSLNRNAGIRPDEIWGIDFVQTGVRVTLKEAQSACDGIGRRIFYSGNPILVGLVQNYLLWRKTEFAQVWSSSPPGEILPVGTGIVTTFDFLELTVANAIALDQKKIMSVCLAGKNLRP